LKDGVKFEFVPIERGEFEMGSATGKKDQRPPHKVTITKPFQIGKYEVTQEQWQSVIKENPSKWKEPQEPVENVKWKDVQRFLTALNEINDGFLYSLPTEAQWEYACRKGNTLDSGKDANEIAVHKGNSGGRPKIVIETQSNALGIYGMLGNVRELCQDKFFEDFYSKSPPADPVADKGFATRRVTRGGSFYDDPAECQPAQRFEFSEAASAEYTGLRLVRVRK
jgi:formylglycine-generating enzyme required for sulfatase activity